ncbi:MAG: asparagine synthase (glutamine-hydrolyzing) [Gaiellaceae bacterium]
MCGICGLYAPHGEPRPELVDAMRARIAHRGPDEGSTDAFGAAVLGHQRLRVIDLEQGGQPVANERGEVVAVFNGELYNFPELRRELSGHELRGTGDTPVIPHLYEEHGLAFAGRLEGMFAVAVWDGRRLVLVRDRLGKKPLVWTRLDDGTFAFSSELKSFFGLPGFRAEPDLAALDAYLALGYVPGDRTGLRAVRRLLPGHLLVVEGAQERAERYWCPAARSTSVRGSEEEWLEQVRGEVGEAVRRRLVADVPLGALLSGGIDSAVVVALMAQAASEPVRTFTVGFADERYDERRYARAVAERWGTRHEEVLLTPDVAATLPRLADAFDEPLGDEAALPLFLICEAARRHVTVALVGDGGDESFAGYERYAAAGLAARVPARPARTGARLLRALPAAAERRSTVVRAARFLEAAAAPARDRYGRLLEVFPPGLRVALWSDEALAEIAPLQTAGELLGPPPEPGVRGLQRLDAVTYLPGDLLPKSDIASMSHSLELRSPLLDRRVLELGLALPDSLRMGRLTGKVALRRAFAPELPPLVAGRGKTGFGVPLAAWFRGELREVAHDVLLDTELFRRDAVERLLHEHAVGRADHGHRLWCLVMLELWQRRYAAAAAIAA